MFGYRLTSVIGLKIFLTIAGSVSGIVLYPVMIILFKVFLMFKFCWVPKGICSLEIPNSNISEQGLK